MKLNIQGIEDFLLLWIQKPEILPTVAFIGLPEDHILNQEKYVKTIVDEYKILSLTVQEPLTKKSIPLIISNKFSFLPDPTTYVGTSKKDAEILQKFSLTPSNHSELDHKTAVEQYKKLGVDIYQASHHLRDWLVSRQRYWGSPIPIIHCTQCGTVPVPDNHLPVELPTFKGLIEKGSSILTENDEWLKCSCPK